MRWCMHFQNMFIFVLQILPDPGEGVCRDGWERHHDQGPCRLHSRPVQVGPFQYWYYSLQWSTYVLMFEGQRTERSWVNPTAWSCVREPFEGTRPVWLYRGIEVLNLRDIILNICRLNEWNVMIIIMKFLVANALPFKSSRNSFVKKKNWLKLMLGLHNSRKTHHKPVECNNGDISCDKYKNT